MKNGRGIWIFIVLILCVGIAVTLGTSGYIARQETLITYDTAAGSGAAAEVIEEGAETEDETQDDTTESPQPKAFAAASKDAAPKSEAADIISIAPIAPIKGATETLEEQLSPEETREFYETRFLELEEEINKRWNEDTDTTVQAMKNTADYELRIWELEMVQFISFMNNLLIGDQKDTFYLQQEQWMKNREVNSLEVSSRYSGSIREELEYTMAMAEYTKERVYELLELYIGLL